MKVKPKEVMVNLPIALLFDTNDEIAIFAANVNTILHGKVRLKFDEIGTLGGRHVAIFYLQRNDEYHQIRDEFVRLMEEAEMEYLEELEKSPKDGGHDDDWGRQ